MKLDEQVTSLELSKKLKELGVKQDSLYFWARNINVLEWGQALSKYRNKATIDGALPKNIVNKLGKWKLVNKKNKKYKDRGWGFCSAFTSAELGDILTKANGALMLNFLHPFKTWSIAPKANLPYFQGKSMEDCLAKMLIYLIENNLLKEGGGK